MSHSTRVHYEACAKLIRVYLGGKESFCVGQTEDLLYLLSQLQHNQ